MLGTRLSPFGSRARQLGSALLLSGLGLASGACELVLGDIPPDDWQPPHGNVADASSDIDDLDASPTDTGHPSTPGDGDDAGGDGDGDDGLDANVGPGDAGHEIDDASVTPPMDSGGHEEPDSSTPKDAGEEKDAAIPCTQLTWYADDDGDGEGNSAKTTKACTKPAGKWVNHGGDCADNDARAKHGQTTYFGTGYAIAGGKVSFDFDCSGQEEPWPGQALAPENCAEFGDQLDCKGSGYAKTARSGLGVYVYCGSATTTSCKRNPVFCGPVNSTATEPFLCR